MQTVAANHDITPLVTWSLRVRRQSASCPIRAQTIAASVLRGQRCQAGRARDRSRSASSTKDCARRPENGANHYRDRMQKVRLVDVARDAGVHPATASRALNPAPRDEVSPATVRRVSRPPNARLRPEHPGAGPAHVALLRRGARRPRHHQRAVPADRPRRRAGADGGRVHAGPDRHEQRGGGGTEPGRVDAGPRRRRFHHGDGALARPAARRARGRERADRAGQPSQRHVRAPVRRRRRPARCRAVRRAPRRARPPRHRAPGRPRRHVDRARTRPTRSAAMRATTAAAPQRGHRVRGASPRRPAQRQPLAVG